MIWLVTNNNQLFQSNLYTKCTVEESFRVLNPLRVVSVDTETEGLDVHTKRLLSVQLGNFDNQVVIDCTSVDISLYREYLESDRLFLFWNAKFDLKFLYHVGIKVNNIYDGFLAEKLMWLGFPSGIHEMSLKAAGLNYVGVELDKSVRGSIIKQGLSDRVIVYAAEDVKYLEKIREKQLEKLQEQDLLTAVEVENEFVKPCSFFEYCGAKIDPIKWQNKVVTDKSALEESLHNLNSWVETNLPGSRWLKINRQGNLFEGFDTRPKCTINWDSNKQVVPIMEYLGVDCNSIDPKTKRPVKSVDKKVLKPQSDKTPLIDLYLSYKKIAIQVKTFGDKFLEALNPKTNRLHCDFDQLGTDTGRLSSANPNLQNLPSDKITRSCFVAEEGNLWLSADYKGQESFLMASIANDKAMLEELIHGSGDLHSLTAKMVFPEIPRDTALTEIKEKYHELRKKAKGYEFLWNYGGGVSTLERNFGLSHEEAVRLDNAYRSGFKGLAAYQQMRRKEVMKLGYILLSPITGHKAYIYDYEDLKKQMAKQNEPGFWEYYKEMKRDAPDCDTVQAVKRLAKRRADSEKQSINYPIQAAGALTFKFACIKFYNYLLKNNLLGTVKLCIPAHDEINCECPKEIAEEIGRVLVDCMRRAGDIFCTRAHLDVDMSIADHWIH